MLLILLILVRFNAFLALKRHLNRILTVEGQKYGNYTIQITGILPQLELYFKSLLNPVKHPQQHHEQSLNHPLPKASELTQSAAQHHKVSKNSSINLLTLPKYHHHRQYMPVGMAKAPK